MTLSELLQRHRALLENPETEENSREAVERLWEPLRTPEEAAPDEAAHLEPPESFVPEASRLELPEERETPPKIAEEPLPLPPELSFPEPEKAPAQADPDPAGAARRVVWSTRRLPQEMEEE